MELLSSGTKKCYIECACGTETVQISTEFEVRKTNEELVNGGIITDQSYNLAFYSYGHTRKMSWLFRIRQALRILKTGEPYSDMIIMNREEAVKLANFVYDNLVTTKPTQHEAQ